MILGYRRVAYEPGSTIGLAHRSNEGDMAAGSKVGKTVINEKDDTEFTLPPFLEFLANKGSGITC